MLTVTTCIILWLGHPLAHLDQSLNIKGIRVQKGKEIEVPSTVAGALKRDYPDSVKIVKGEPVTPGSEGDPVAALKAAKRNLRTDPVGLFADVPTLPVEVREKLAKLAKDADPRAFVPVGMRAHAALWARLSGHDDAAQKLLAAEGG